MKLSTKRLILRPWQLQDAHALYKYAQDKRVAHMAGFPIHTSIQNSKEILKNILITPTNFAITLKENANIAIGSIGLIKRAEYSHFIKENELELGYWIGVPFWGQGIASEAAQSIIEYAFTNLALDALWCGYYEGNLKSYNVQIKQGFKPIHTIKNVELPFINEHKDEHFTKLLKKDWLLKQKSSS